MHLDGSHNDYNTSSSISSTNTPPLTAASARGCPRLECTHRPLGHISEGVVQRIRHSRTILIDIVLLILLFILLHALAGLAASTASAAACLAFLPRATGSIILQCRIERVDGCLQLVEVNIPHCLDAGLLDFLQLCRLLLCHSLELFFSFFGERSNLHNEQIFKSGSGWLVIAKPLELELHQVLHDVRLFPIIDVELLCNDVCNEPCSVRQ
mmetsp:Transcript_66578/g.128848  ORF Transcript_66578/g.128848 Transcript_66578/m.128848 type:complete len:211 (+) Transcript_66578:269-901(+)